MNLPLKIPNLDKYYKPGEILTNKKGVKFIIVKVTSDTIYIKRINFYYKFIQWIKRWI